LAEAHWRYIGGLLKVAGIVDDVGLLKYLYVNALIHGIKHGEVGK